jgi:predicted HTH transcriptional regulator
MTKVDIKLSAGYLQVICRLIRRKLPGSLVIREITIILFCRLSAGYQLIGQLKVIGVNNVIDYNKKLPQEDEHIEYKTSKNAFPKDAWETISAFMNTDGGVLVLGIEEIKGHQFMIAGVHDSQNIKDEFWSSINNKGVLSYNGFKNSDIKTIRTDTTEVIQIQVREAPDSEKPVFLRGDERQAYVRNGATDAKARGESLMTLVRLSRDNLDTKVLPNYGIDDLSENSIQDYKSMLVKRETYRYYTNYPLEKFLRGIGVLSKDYDNNGKIGVTAGGLLFFGLNNSILHAFPNFQLDYFDKSHPEHDRWSRRISSIEEDLNIFSFFRRTEEALLANTPGNFEMDRNGQRIDTFGSMAVALREGLINMLMHADYFGESPLVVNNLTKYYEFQNPGKMKIPSNEFFTTNNSSTRNPIISKLFIQMGIGERAGHGGEKIYESAVTNHFRQPEIRTDLKGTQLTIWKVDYAESFGGKDINKRERAVLKAIVSSQRPGLSHKEIETQTQLSRSRVTTALNSLILKQILVVSGRGPSTRYGLPQTNEQIIAQAQAIPDMLRQLMSTNKNSKSKK